MSNRVILRFLGEDSSLRRSIRQVSSDLSDMSDRSKTAFGKISQSAGVAASALKGLAVGGAALNVASGMQAIVAVAVKLAAAAALLLPAALATAGAAVATLKIGLTGVSDALGGDAKALKALSPAARETVLAITSLHAAWKKVQDATQ